MTDIASRSKPAKQHLNQTERELDAAIQRIGKKYNWNIQAFFADVQQQLRDKQHQHHPSRTDPDPEPAIGQDTRKVSQAKGGSS